MEKQKGLYLGTEINEKWWKRYAKDKFLSRGNGEFWRDENGFYFLRYLSKEPIFIPCGSILEIKTGKWHSGKWALGNLILKIIWRKDGLRLSSGFLVSKNKEEVIKLKQELENLLNHFSSFQKT